ALARQVFAVHVRDSLAHDEPQLAEERLPRLREIMLDPLQGIDVRFLEHVRRRYAAGEPVIEPQFHHAPQLVAVAIEQLRKRSLTSGLQAGDEPGDLRFGIGWHNGISGNGSPYLKTEGGS